MSFRSFAVSDFWKHYKALPQHIQRLADKKYALFEQQPFHPSLGLEQKGEVWTVDIGRAYRAMAYRDGSGFHWFWIGSHEEYNQLLRRKQ